MKQFLVSQQVVAFVEGGSYLIVEGESYLIVGGEYCQSVEPDVSPGCVCSLVVDSPRDLE